MNNGGNAGQTSNLLDVALALKENIFRTLNCADVLMVNEVNDDSYVCTKLNDSSLAFNCIALSGQSYQQGDIVLCIFADTDFRVNLTKVQNGKKPSQFITLDRHSLSYGVIIGLVYGGN